MLTQSKKTDERKWLSDVSSVPLQQSLRDLDAAYKNFFNSLKGKRKGKKVGTPRFKKKTNSQSAEFTKAGFSVKDDEVYLAKIGTIKPIWSIDFGFWIDDFRLTSSLKKRLEQRIFSVFFSMIGEA